MHKLNYNTTQLFLLLNFSLTHLSTANPLSFERPTISSHCTHTELFRHLSDLAFDQFNLVTL